MDCRSMPEMSAIVQFPNLSKLATTGVYFLYRDGLVVYVGQARNVRARIGQHISEGRKTFDGVTIIPCSTDRLNRIEAHYIDLLKPLYNACHVSRRSRFEDDARGVSLHQPAPITSDFDTDDSAAAFLGISVSELHRFQSEGKGPVSKRYPRSSKRRYPLWALRQFASEHLS